MTTFEQACEFLERIGASYRQDYDWGKQGTEERHEFDVKVFNSVFLPFTPEEWCELCMSDGEFYIGGCCGTTSVAQDKVAYSFRHDSGWMSCRDLAEVADLLSNHDENEESAYLFSGLKEPLADAVQHAWERWAEIDPWEKMALVWHIVKDYYNPEVPLATRTDMPPLDAAIRTVTTGLQLISYDQVFGWSQDQEGNPTSQGIANRAISLAKILPALKLVYEQLDTLDFGGFEGFALIDKAKGPEAIAENGRGPCLFRTQAEVDELLALWRKNEEQYEEKTERTGKIDDRIGVRRVRVTKEKGVEFLGD